MSTQNICWNLGKIKYNFSHSFHNPLLNKKCLLHETVGSLNSLFRWGDIQLHSTSDGVQYLELNERQTKTRTGDDVTDVREVTPKMFATGDIHCPVEAYKVYSSKRPRSMMDSDSPFYVACRTVQLHDPEKEIWFINQRVGQKKLGKMMKMMQTEGKLNPAKRLTNHSARKHLVQKLRDSDVAPTDIMQISGHKNIQSVMTYSKMSDKQHRLCSDILSNSTTSKIHKSQTVSSTTIMHNNDKENVLTKSSTSTSHGIGDAASRFAISNQSVMSNRQSNQSISGSSNEEVEYPTHVMQDSVSIPGAIPGVPQHLQSLFSGATLNITNLNLFMNGKN